MRLALIAVMALLLAACGSEENAAADTPTAETADTASSSHAPSPAPAIETGNQAAPATVQARQPPADAAGACMMQGSERLTVKPRRAVGTEPFWSARIDGRCVHYSHPDDQAGTRVWTRYTKGPAGEVWSGAHDGRLFELLIHPRPGCSDGMSDKQYPLAVELIVRGEQRKGCAEPI